MSEGFAIWCEYPENVEYIGRFPTYEEAADYLKQLGCVLDSIGFWSENWCTVNDDSKCYTIIY